MVVIVVGVVAVAVAFAVAAGGGDDGHDYQKGSKLMRAVRFAAVFKSLRALGLYEGARP